VGCFKKDRKSQKTPTLNLKSQISQKSINGAAHLLLRAGTKTTIILSITDPTLTQTKAPYTPSKMKN